MSIERKIKILQFIPMQPPGVSIQQLKTKLAYRDIVCDTRTLQRDLIDLSAFMPLINDTQGRTHYWYWQPQASLMQFPSMDTQTALTFKFIEKHLTALLPPSVREQLKKHFHLATTTLDSAGAENLRHWSDRVRVVPSEQPLLVAEPNAAANHVIYESLLEKQTFNSAYVSRTRLPNDTKEGVIHPLGIVYRGQVGYLIGCRDGEAEPKQFALHRFIWAEPSHIPLQEPEHFSLSDYLNDGYLAYPEGGTMALKLRVAPGLARILEERQLSADQTLSQDPDAAGWLLLTATVQETAQLRWWLLSQGDNLEVLAPPHVRQTFKQTLETMVQWYQQG